MSSLAARLPAELARHVKTGRELVEEKKRAERHASEEDVLATSTPLDALLGGGLRRGSLVEVQGWGSSGRFSLVLSALAAVTARGEAAALVDLGDGLDPRRAAELGVELPRLLWLRPRRLKEALRATESLLDAALPLVVLDLGIPPVPGGRGAEAFWLRLGRAARDHRVALLVSSPYRVSGTAADAVVETRDRRGCWHGRGREPRLLGGLESLLALLKGPGWQLGRDETLRLATAW